MKFSRTAIASLLLIPSTARAHGTVCVAHNDQTTAVGSALTPAPTAGTIANVHAWQFVPNRSVFPRAAFLFTGSPNGDDFMRIEVWTDNNGAPGTRILGGATAAPQNPNAEWIGTNFATTGFLNRFTPHWLVWTEAGDAILPVEPSGATLPYSTLDATGAWVAGTPSAAKLRLFCGDTIDSPEVLRTGFSCFTAIGDEPSLWSNQEPIVGNAAFALQATHLPSTANAWLLIGFDPMFQPLPLDSLLGAPPACTLNVQSVLNFTSSVGSASIGDGNPGSRPRPAGHLRFAFPIPPGPALTSSVVTVQCAAIDSASGAALPLITTNALTITLQ